MGHEFDIYTEDGIVNDPGWMDWMIRECCLTGDKDADIRIWTAYGMVKKAYREEVDGPFVEAPNTILAGECAIRCSELTSDTDAVIAAMVYRPASGGTHGCTLSRIRERLGMTARMYAEKLIALEYTSNLDEYNKILAEGLPEGLLAAETAILWCNANRLLDKYAIKASEPGNMFEIHTDTGLILLQRNQLAAKIGSCYSKTEILHNYVKSELKAKLVFLRTTIMGLCSAVHDVSIWGHLQ